MKFSTTIVGCRARGALFAPAAQAQDTIKIGWAISKTGPFGPGAAVTTLPNYQVWVKDVNDAGGLNVGGKKMKIEVIEYDDRSNSEEMIKAVERLATQDKVDFILPPWSTGMNLAAAPMFNKYGYPHLAVTANSNRAPEMVKRWPNLTFWLGLPSELIDGLVDTLSTAAQGRQDRHQGRDGRRRRPVRHRAVDRGARRAEEGRLRARLRQVLSVRQRRTCSRSSRTRRPPTPTPSSRSAIRRTRSASPIRPRSRASARRCSSSASAPHSRCSRASSAPAPKA